MYSWYYNKRNNFETDFSFMNPGSKFPTERMKFKNADYKFRKKQMLGAYGYDRYLDISVDGVEKSLPIKVLSLNYYKLLVNKISDLVFNNEVIIKSGDTDTDVQINKLVVKKNWVYKMRQAFRSCMIYGDSYTKTYKNGVSVFNPINGFKVVDVHDVSKTKAYVLYEYLRSGYIRLEDELPPIRAIRFEVHLPAHVFEIVMNYSGDGLSGKIGSSVEYYYAGRKIPKGGTWYKTNVADAELVQCMSVNKEIDGVYGISTFVDIQDIVNCLEERITVENSTLNSLQKPLIIVGRSAVEEDFDNPGHYRLKVTNGNMMVVEDGTTGSPMTPQSFQQDYKLDAYDTFIDRLKGELYELSEMGKTFMSSEYSGNISEETLNNLIKGAIDKANRTLTDCYDSFIDSLYALCQLNNINVEKDSLNILFNISQTDDDKSVADICNILTTTKVLSKRTVREKYFGYTAEQSDLEDKQIAIENGDIDNNESIVE